MRNFQRWNNFLGKVLLIELCILVFLVVWIILDGKL